MDIMESALKKHKEWKGKIEIVSRTSVNNREELSKDVYKRQGKYVPIKETIRGFKEIIEGKHDDLPESAFLFVGTIDEAVEKAKKGED